MTSEDYERYGRFFRRGKESTKRRNAWKLRHFCKWIKMTPEDLIAEFEKAKEENRLDVWEREQVNRISEFYNWILEQTSPRTGKNYTINYARSEASGIGAFHKQNTRALQGATSTFAPPQMATNEYRFTQDDLRKMFYFGDTKEKAFISVAVCFGQGAKEFLELECQKMRNLAEEAQDRNLDFIMWISKARSKTSVQPRSFLTPEAISSLEQYLKLLEKQHGKLPKYLWCNGQTEKHITNQALNKQLRRLVEKANIKIHNKSVHFHLIRKFTYSRLRRIDKDMAKVIVAKSISASDMTYEELDEQCEKVFKLAYKDISLNGDVLGKRKHAQQEKIEQLERAIVKLQQDSIDYKSVNEVLGKEVKKLEQALEKEREDRAHDNEKAMSAVWKMFKKAGFEVSEEGEEKP